MVERDMRLICDHQVAGTAALKVAEHVETVFKRQVNQQVPAEDQVSPGRDSFSKIGQFERNSFLSPSLLVLGDQLRHDIEPQIPIQRLRKVELRKPVKIATRGIHDTPNAELLDSAADAGSDSLGRRQT